MSSAPAFAQRIADCIARRIRKQVATKVEVKIGRRRAGSVEILHGLNEGDVIVREGTQDLQSGAKVAILKPRAEST